MLVLWYRAQQIQLIDSCFCFALRGPACMCIMKRSLFLGMLMGYSLAKQKLDRHYKAFSGVHTVSQVFTHNKSGDYLWYARKAQPPKPLSYCSGEQSDPDEVKNCPSSFQNAVIVHEFHHEITAHPCPPSLNSPTLSVDEWTVIPSRARSICKESVNSMTKWPHSGTLFCSAVRLWSQATSYLISSPARHKHSRATSITQQFG
jgi:hypothetical protein